jgi:hypothetical protein
MPLPRELRPLMQRSGAESAQAVLRALASLTTDDDMYAWKSYRPLQERVVRFTRSRDSRIAFAALIALGSMRLSQVTDLITRLEEDSSSVPTKVVAASALGHQALEIVLAIRATSDLRNIDSSLLDTCEGTLLNLKKELAWIRGATV